MEFFINKLKNSNIILLDAFKTKKYKFFNKLFGDLKLFMKKAKLSLKLIV
jgi:hypothetical protein